MVHGTWLKANGQVGRAGLGSRSRSGSWGPGPGMMGACDSNGSVTQGTNVQLLKDSLLGDTREHEGTLRGTSDR